MIGVAHASYFYNKAAIQRGANFFMNYCAGCHSLRYMHPNLMVSMPATDARQWFGRMPPDLSLIARERGSQWLYAYLTSFYPDKTRPFGANNTLVPDVAMPNVLYPIATQPGLDEHLQDVVSFLVYIAEPKKMIRYHMGMWVLSFLSIFVLLLYGWALKCGKILACTAS